MPKKLPTQTVGYQRDELPIAHVSTDQSIHPKESLLDFLIRHVGVQTFNMAMFAFYEEAIRSRALINVDSYVLRSTLGSYLGESAVAAREELFHQMQYAINEELKFLHKSTTPIGRAGLPAIVNMWKYPDVMAYVVKNDYDKAMRALRDCYVKSVGLSDLRLDTLKYGGRALGVISALTIAYKIQQSDSKFQEIIHQGSLLLGGYAAALHVGSLSVAPCSFIGPYAPFCVGTASLAGGILGAEGTEKLYEYFQTLKFPSLMQSAHGAAVLDDQTYSYTPIKSGPPHGSPEPFPISLLPNKKEDEAMPTQQAIQNLKRDVQPLLTSFKHIVAASEKIDIKNVEDIPGVKELDQKIQDLEQRHRTGKVDLTREISEEKCRLNSIVIPELIRREDFTRKIHRARETVQGVAGIISPFNEKLAQQISIVGHSITDVAEQVSALFGIGVMASSFNPVFAMGTIVEAIGNIVRLFNKKHQPDPSVMILRAINQLFLRIGELAHAIHAEFISVSSAIDSKGWQILSRLTDVMNHQHEMLAFLNAIMGEVRSIAADQDARLSAIAEGMSHIAGNLHATRYHDDLDILKERFMYFIDNTVFENYNELTNQLDYLGLQRSITNQISDLFHLESRTPASYFQLHSYFAHLISFIVSGKKTKMRELPSPFPLIHACVGKIVLGLKQYPKHNDPDEGLRIAKRDIAQLEVYDVQIAEIETLIWQARDPKVLNHVIMEYISAAIALYTAIGEKTYKDESTKTSEIHRKRMVRLSKKHDEEMVRFRKAFDVSAYDLFTGTKIHAWRRHIGRWVGNNESEPYVDEIKRKEYIVLQTKHIQSAIDDWSDKISEYQTLAAENHLSTTASATISSYHGARFLKPTQPHSPYLPAPDPLLPANHTQLEVMRVLQEAQAYGLGTIELFYNATAINNQTGTFVIEIIFQRTTAPVDSPELIATLTFPYDPLPDYNREEAIWSEWMGNPEFIPQLEGEMKSTIKGNKPWCWPPDNCGGYGHKGGEFEYHEWLVKIPEPPIVKKGRLTEFQREHNIPLTVQEDQLTAIRGAIQEARQQFITEIRDQESNSLDAQMQNPLGRLCSDFEKASHHLYGVLSYAYFDEMQNPESRLAKWFTNHAFSIQQLRRSLVTEAPQDLLIKLSADLPQLQEIISTLPASSLHFHLLSETRLELQGFLELYTPYAVDHNYQLPSKNQSERVKEIFTKMVMKFYREFLIILPPEEAASRAQQILEEASENSDPLVIKEVLRRLRDQSAADARALPASDVASKLNDTLTLPNTTESAAQKKPSEPNAQQPSRKSGKTDSPKKETDSIGRKKAFVGNNNGGQTFITMDSTLSPQHINLSDYIVSQESIIPSDRVVSSESEIPAEFFPATTRIPTKNTRRDTADNSCGFFSWPNYNVSIDGNLGLLRLVIHLGSKWLPWNKKRELTDNDVNALESCVESINIYREHLEQLAHGPVSRYEIGDEMEEAEKFLDCLGDDIEEARKSSSITDSQLGEFHRKLTRMGEIVSRLEKIDKQLRGFEEEAKGKRVVVRYNHLSGKLTKEESEKPSISTEKAKVETDIVHSSFINKGKLPLDASSYVYNGMSWQTFFQPPVASGGNISTISCLLTP